MNLSPMILEISVAVLGLGILLLDLWTPRERKRDLGYAAAGLLFLILTATCLMDVPAATPDAATSMIVVDSLAWFFKRFFLLAAVLVLLFAVEFAERFDSGVSEYYSLVLFALTGMLYAAGANDFILVFVALELITITFYVLTSFQRRRLASLEAGVKYLILGGLSSAFLVFGIALIFGAAGTTNFAALKNVVIEGGHQTIFQLGLLLVMVGLFFKIAAFPFQIWAPDVYQGAPAPTTAFLAVGSKAAGIALLMRVLLGAVPDITLHWEGLLMGIAAVTILYGNLCAIPQRNLKRLLGYSSIANAGYLLLGFATVSAAGASAILYYLAGYLFAVLAAFTVIGAVSRETESEDISVLAGLHQRSPFLAAALGLSMVSLAGIPPLAGFFGKFLLLKAVIEQGASYSRYYCLAGVALVGVVISLYYYLGVVRAIYWSKDPADLSPLPTSGPTRISLWICMAGMLYLGLFPDALITFTDEAVKVFKF